MSKMAGNFKVGDLVWAKMKGFPNWPGKVIAPKPEVKRPANKKNQQFVFFFGSENYAWIQEENMHIYADHRNKFMLSQRIPRGYKEAIEAIEDALKAQPEDIRAVDLPSIEDELAQIFPMRKEAPLKDYSRDSGRKRKKSPSPHPVSAKTKTIKDRRSSAPPAPMRDRRRSSLNDQKKNGKNSTSGVRPGRDAALAGKETAKSRKNDRGATPKVLPKSSKIVHKPAKRPRKVKPTTPTQSTDNINEPQDEKLAKDTVPDAEKVKDSNHTEEDLDAEFGVEDETAIPEPQESDAQVKPEDRVESPDIFSSEEGEASSSHNGPQHVDEEPVLATTSDIAADELSAENNNSFTGVSDTVVTTQEATSVKEPTSARGENIFEMFSQQKDNGIIYQGGEVTEEVIDEMEDDDKVDDDDGDYAIVTVDPDGQAHVLLNAETIIDDDVVVLGQEEEVETEGVDAEANVSIEEAMDIDISVKVPEEPQEETLPSTSTTSIIEQIPYQENIDLKPDSSEQHVVSPEPDLPEDQESWDQLDQTETEVEAPADSESLSVTVPEEAPIISENSIDSETALVDDNREKIEQDWEGSEVQPEEKPQIKTQEESATEQESQSESEIKTESATEGETPTRRSTRVRKPREEANDKTKREEPRVGGPGRKPKDASKVDTKSASSRRQSHKRPASPVSATTTKRGKMVNKLPGSPGRSAAPADYKLSGGVPLDEIEPAVAGSAKQDIIPTPLKIGFLGLGIMGTGMVENLLKSGHEVTVWNRTGQKCREFMKEGALKGNTPAEVVAACDVTFSCVSDPAAVKDLVFGNCGVLQGIQPGKGYVEMSTIDPDTVADVQEAVTSQGGRFLEAPVVGSRGPASTGQLIILAAGDRMLYEDCFSCFEAMGKKTFFLGETTSGCKMKLVVNMLMGTCVAGLAESLALADKVGLDQDALLQILDLSVMSCPLIRGKGQAIMMSRFEPQFPLQHQQKDLRLSINMADSVDQPLHVATAVNELFKKAKAKGYSQHDMCAVYRAADM